MALLENWERWTSFLGQQVDDAKQQGMPKKVIEKTAVQIGDYLAKNVDPKNEQERVLSDLWGVASEKPVAERPQLPDTKVVMPCLMNGVK